MLETMSDYLFGMGLFLNTIIIIPQFFLLLKKKRADNVSFLTFLGFCLIQLFIIFHGIYIHDKMLVIGYLFSLAACAAITCLIAIYKLRDRHTRSV